MMKLQTEMGMRVVPAAGRLVEALRVANLLTDGPGTEPLAPHIARGLDELHSNAVDLAARVVEIEREISGATSS